MKAYVVGGAVRDALLGLPGHDRDWVVVGETADTMVAAGFRPVGRDFPVFLHPQTGEEYALARTERKNGRGYRGFQVYASPDVTLEEDLERRDLTINAMAQAPGGELVDPWGGARDLQAKVLRHVGAHFVEDPVRILRLARFAARFPDFTVAPETARLMAVMVDQGEVDTLVPERVWQELSRGLMAARPSRMIEVLHDCGALDHLLPGRKGALATLGRVSDAAAIHGEVLAVRWAVFMAALVCGRPEAADTVARLCARLRTPADSRDLAILTARECPGLDPDASLDTRDAGDIVTLFDRCDAWRKPERFDALLRACALLCDSAREAGTGAVAPNRSPGHAQLRQALSAARALDAGAIAAQVSAATAQAAETSSTCPGGSGPAGRIRQALEFARRKAVAQSLSQVGAGADLQADAQTKNGQDPAY